LNAPAFVSRFEPSEIGFILENDKNRRHRERQLHPGVDLSEGAPELFDVGCRALQLGGPSVAKNRQVTCAEAFPIAALTSLAGSQEWRQCQADENG
jgi:hypothetical protein